MAALISGPKCAAPAFSATGSDFKADFDSLMLAVIQ